MYIISLSLSGKHLLTSTFLFTFSLSLSLSLWQSFTNQYMPVHTFSLSLSLSSCSSHGLWHSFSSLLGPQLSHRPVQPHYWNSEGSMIYKFTITAIHRKYQCNFLPFMINTHVVKFRLHFRKKCLLVYNKCILTVFKEIGESINNYLLSTQTTSWTLFISSSGPLCFTEVSIGWLNIRWLSWVPRPSKRWSLV